jgi:hypothetical protein
LSQDKEFLIVLELVEQEQQEPKAVPANKEALAEALPLAGLAECLASLQMAVNPAAPLLIIIIHLVVLLARAEHPVKAHKLVVLKPLVIITCKGAPEGVFQDTVQEAWVPLAPRLQSMAWPEAAQAPVEAAATAAKIMHHRATEPKATTVSLL